MGNPGPAYERTRHNVGFMVVDEVARRLGVEKWRTKDFARQAHVAQKRVVLVEPQSYMNESGYPTRKIAAWWKTPRSDILVVSDDLDLPLGRLRMRADGGSGGHNGLKSMIEELGGQDFPRLRVGIGRGDDAIDHVLNGFDQTEQAMIGIAIQVAADGAMVWLDEGIVPAMQLLNAWRQPSP